MTGTLIQNSLNDLLSLLKFLHLEPYCQPAVFERDILSPIRAGNSDAFKNLKLLLRAVCLRRNSQPLNLEPVRFETISVALDAEERKHYKAIQTLCQTEFENITSQKSQLKRYSVLFTTIVHLRRLCSNGQPPVQTPPAAGLLGNKRAAKGKKKAASDDNRCEVCGDEDSAGLLDGCDVCPECSRPLASSTNSNSALSKSSTATHLTPGTPLTVSQSRSPSPLSTASSPSLPYLAMSSKLNAVAINTAQHKNDGKRSASSPGHSTLSIDTFK